MIVAWLVWGACATAPAPQAESAAEPCDACEGACLSTHTPNTSRNHVSGPVDYAEDPPSSGDHNPCWAEWGVHTETVPVENWVHNLEHGGVVFLVDCPDGCEAERAELEAYVLGLPEGRGLLTPYSGAPQPFTVVAWEHKLELGCLDLEAIAAFYDAHVGRAPEDTPSGPAAECM